LPLRDPRGVRAGAGASGRAYVHVDMFHEPFVVFSYLAALTESSGRSPGPDRARATFEVSTDPWFVDKVRDVAGH
jgi:hypothetical protein